MASIGMNLAGLAYYGTQDPFIDRFKTAGTWTTSAGAVASLNAEGYPTAVPAGSTNVYTAVQVDPTSAGTSQQYVLTYDGTAKFTFSGATVVSSKPGQVIINVVAQTGNPDIAIKVQGLDRSNPLTDIHLVRSDQVSLFNAGEMFNPVFVDKLSKFGILRFMEWQNTNASLPVSWATRSQASGATWATAAKPDGVPLEVMVQLANEAHTDMWYNVPTQADNTYVTNALTYIKNNLDPDLKVHVEYSNEVWNTAFAANTYAQNKANALWGVDKNHNGIIDRSEAVANGAETYYGYRSAQVAAIAQSVFATASSSQLRMVLGGWAINPSASSAAVQGIALARTGSVSALFDDYAIATYFGSELGSSKASDVKIVLGWANSGAAGLTAAFHELQYGGALSTNLSLAAMAKVYVSDATFAHANGLDLVAYEGGAGFISQRIPAASRAKVTAFFGQLYDDPRMGALYTQMIADFTAAGGTSLVAYDDVGSNSIYGDYGVLKTIYSTGSPRYDALVAAAAVTADPGWHQAATLDWNGDGNSDIIWRNDAGGFSISNGTGSDYTRAAYTGSAPTSWSIVATADLTGDGRSDILWQSADGSIFSWVSTGDNFLQNVYSHAPVGAGWTVAGAADFNGDEQSDILWRTSAGGVALWTNNGGGTSFNETAFYQGGVPTAWHVAGISDFNGDGKADILWRNDGGAVTAWLSNGTGFTEQVFNAWAPTDWTVGQLGDFNADGLSDIVWRNAAGAVAVWSSNGSGWDQQTYSAAALDWAKTTSKGLS